MPSATGLPQNAGICRVCARNDPATAEAAFRARLWIPAQNRFARAVLDGKPDAGGEAFGSEGMLAASNVTPTAVRSYSKSVTAAAEPYLPFFLERYADSYKVELDTFAQSIQTGAPCKPDFQDGVEALLLANAALESARTGNSVKLTEKMS